MKKSTTGLLIGAALAVYSVASAYVITRQGIEPLLICADSGGLKVPFSKELCRTYLHTARGTPQDISDLQNGIGASFVVQGESSTKERLDLLIFLKGKGLDLNLAGANQLPPLHASIVANRPEEVKLLLQAGASTGIKDTQFNLLPVEFAEKLQNESINPSSWQETIEALKQVQKQ